jgi:hypothetical protein
VLYLSRLTIAIFCYLDDFIFHIANCEQEHKSQPWAEVSFVVYKRTNEKLILLFQEGKGKNLMIYEAHENLHKHVF